MYWSATACLVVVLYCLYWFRRLKGLPPGPMGVPIFGTIPFLGKYPERKMQKWSSIYGPIMSVRIGTEDQVVLSSYDSIVKALRQKSTFISGRPDVPLIQQVNFGNGMFFVDYGDKWKSQRNFGMTTLRGLDVGRRSMESKILEEVACLNNYIRAETGKPFGISVIIKNAVLNNICSVVVGRRFDYDDPRFQEIIRRMLERFSEPVYNAVILFLTFAPKMRHIPPFSYYNKLFVEDFLAINKLIEEIIEEHEATFDRNVIRDFVDAFIQEKKKKKDPFFTNDQLVLFVRDLFSGGTETSSSTICWALLCCLRYPQSQRKVREEIMKVFGPEGKISMSKKSEMPFTNAFIQEVYRFRTLVPLSLPHKTNEDTEIGGYFLPKDTTVLPNIWAVHNDPNLWDEPEKFKPERFLDEKGNYLPSSHVIPYSVGPRHCLGEQLARMEIFMFLVGMIQKFEFLPDPSADQLPDIEKGSNGIIYVPVPFKIVANQL